MSEPSRFDRGHTDDLMSFLAASPSPYHAVANTAERLEKAGFRQVAETDAWDVHGHRPLMISGVVLHALPAGYRFDLRRRHRIAGPALKALAAVEAASS